MAYATVNPYTGETLKEFPFATEQEVKAAIDAGYTAFTTWKDSSFATRAEVLNKAAKILRDKTDYYAKFLTLEMGKLFKEAQGEVEICAQIFEYYAKHAEELLAPSKLSTANKEIDATIYYEPQGIVMAVEPWNFPFYQIARILSAQLAAGNTVILKHASIVPQSANAFEQLLLDAGLPQGAFKNLYMQHEHIPLVLNDHRVCGVALTGSEGAGAEVAAHAGKALKKSTLELGGSDAFIVLKDADLEKTAQLAVSGRHSNAGQVCTASKRFIVVDEVYDQFVELYKQGVAKLKAGDPMDPDTTLAPLCSQDAADQLKKQVEKAKAAGATVEAIGAPVPEQGAFFQPLLMTDIHEDNEARYWEFFGPVTQLYRAKDEADAIRIANDSPFGLGGSVYTADHARGVEVAKQIQTGMVYINHPTTSQADLPFGGVGRSGYGRELIDLGLKEFVNHKLIAITDIDAKL